MSDEAVEGRVAAVPRSEDAMRSGWVPWFSDRKLLLLMSVGGGLFLVWSGVATILGMSGLVAFVFWFTVTPALLTPLAHLGVVLTDEAFAFTALVEIAVGAFLWVYGRWRWAVPFDRRFGGGAVVAEEPED